MTQPLLFQHFDANSSKLIHMAVFQKIDTEYILACKSTLEAELRQIIAPGDVNKIFLNPEEGLWFGNVQQNKKGLAVRTAQLTKTGQEYANRVSSILKSPPKKRPQIKIVEPPQRPSFQSTHPVPAPSKHLIPSIIQKQPNQDDLRVLQIQEEFKKQKQANTQFDLRINKLELTTNEIDSNVDRNLDILQQDRKASPPRSHKAQQMSENMLCDQEDHPDPSGHRQPLRELCLL